MSKENVFHFFTKAAQDHQLKDKVQATASPDELADLAQSEGYTFAPEHVDDAINEMKKQPGFFGKIAEGFLLIFGPNHPEYPAVGVQPYSGDPNRD
ncbi:Nif11 family protein [Synechococcales cyanobacterium C]|uniref:Nif11 family protein n=1 Tax=Petrachloros mirabilis ULC683 TaxID=2781853 RepID=A0A8K2A1P0_9CYAN|nr:Nif11-like leader peptide family natural product precursor [Petrachloros mirabilis]NCJ07837.1 Nif11 family protein [Petrachloros mirabilis ULC683]